MAVGEAAPRRSGRTADWQGRLLPRSVLGISALVLAAALGAAFSGAVLYAYYEFRLDTTDLRAEEFATTFADRLDDAVAIIEAEREAGVATIRTELEPLQRIAASGETLEALLEQISPSVFFVSTLGTDGQPSVGSAFVVFSNAEQSFLLTSYATIEAATVSPGPDIRLRKGGDEIGADLVTWEAGRDLALLAIDRGNIERLPWAMGDPPTRVGERLFSVSGLGAAGGAISQGLVADVSSVGIQHDAPVGTHFQGGPLVNSNGEVIAVSSRSYAPLGFAAEAVFFAPPVRAACESVLQCPTDEGAEGVGG